jgi:hypothetical protein
LGDDVDGCHHTAVPRILRPYVLLPDGYVHFLHSWCPCPLNAHAHAGFSNMHEATSDMSCCKVTRLTLIRQAEHCDAPHSTTRHDRRCCKSLYCGAGALHSLAQPPTLVVLFSAL